MDAKSRDTGHAVRLTDESYQRLLSLQQVIASRGWQVVGVESAEPATLAAVLGMTIAQVSDLVAELEVEKQKGKG